MLSFELSLMRWSRFHFPNTLPELEMPELQYHTKRKPRKEKNKETRKNKIKENEKGVVVSSRTRGTPANTRPSTKKQNAQKTRTERKAIQSRSVDHALHRVAAAMAGARRKRRGARPVAYWDTAGDVG